MTIKYRHIASFYVFYCQTADFPSGHMNKAVFTVKCNIYKSILRQRDKLVKMIKKLLTKSGQ